MATLEELDRELLNGFHDAQLRGIHVDYPSREAELNMELLISGPGDPSDPAYRTATLKISGLALFYIEPPDPKYNFEFNGSLLNLSGDSVTVGQGPVIDHLLSRLPAEVSAYRFFLQESNCFLYLAGRSATYAWDSELLG